MPRKKYSKELKLEIVKYVTEQNHTADGAGERYGIDDATIRKWMSLYKYHGMEGLDRKTQRYTAEFKESVVKDMQENKLSLKEGLYRHRRKERSIEKDTLLFFCKV